MAFLPTQALNVQVSGFGVTPEPAKTTTTTTTTTEAPPKKQEPVSDKGSMVVDFSKSFYRVPDGFKLDWIRKGEYRVRDANLKRVPTITDKNGLLQRDAEEPAGGVHFQSRMHEAFCLDGTHLWFTGVGDGKRFEVPYLPTESRVRYVASRFPVHDAKVEVHMLFQGMGAIVIAPPEGTFAKIARTMASFVKSPTGTSGASNVLAFFSTNLPTAIQTSLSESALPQDAGQLLDQLEIRIKKALKEVQATWIQKQVDVCKTAGKRVDNESFADTLGACACSILVTCGLVNLMCGIGGGIAAIRKGAPPTVSARSADRDQFALVVKNGEASVNLKDVSKDLKLLHYPGLTCLGTWISGLIDWPGMVLPTGTKSNWNSGVRMLTRYNLEVTPYKELKKLSTPDLVSGRLGGIENYNHPKTLAIAERMLSDWTFASAGDATYVALHTGVDRGSTGHCNSLLANCKVADGETDVPGYEFARSLVNAISLDSAEMFLAGIRSYEIQTENGWDVSAACVVISVKPYEGTVITF